MRDRFLSGGRTVVRPASDFDALASLVNLTDLRIISCGMVDVSPLEELVGLNTLVLTDNDIEDLSPLLDNMGLGAGDFINVEENPSLRRAFAHRRNLCFDTLLKLE